MKKIIQDFTDVIAGEEVRVRYYYDDETELYSFQTNPQLKDKDQLDYHNFGGGSSIDKDLKGLKFKYENSYKKEFKNIVDKKENPDF